MRGLLRDAGFNTYDPPGRERFVNYMRSNLERYNRDEKRLADRKKVRIGTAIGLWVAVSSAGGAVLYSLAVKLLPAAVGRWLPPP